MFFATSLGLLAAGKASLDVVLVEHSRSSYWQNNCARQLVAGMESGSGREAFRSGGVVLYIGKPAQDASKALLRRWNAKPALGSVYIPRQVSSEYSKQLCLCSVLCVPVYKWLQKSVSNLILAELFSHGSDRAGISSHDVIAVNLECPRELHLKAVKPVGAKRFATQIWRSDPLMELFGKLPLPTISDMAD